MSTSTMRPPGPRGRPFVGNLKAYEDDRLGFLLRTRDHYGDVVALDERTTVINGGRLAVELLLDRPKALALHENFLQERLSVAADEEAVSLRRLLNPGLRESTISSALSPLVQRVDAEALDWLALSGEPVDPVPVLERAIAANVAAYYFGEEGQLLGLPLARLLDALSRTILDPFVLPWSSLSPARRATRRRYAVVHAEVCGLLKRRQSTGALDDLAGQVVGADAGATPLSRLADLVIGSMLAGQRVPAAAGAWALMLIADRPEVQSLLRHESRVVACEASLESVRASDIPLAVACVLESLRLYPATWLLSRRSVAPVSVGNYTFPAGHHFMVSPYVIHRDEREYREAESFKLERWTSATKPAGAYLPFGHGVHVCPGRHLATITLAVAILRLIGAGLIRRHGHQVTPNARTTLLPDGLRLSLEPLSIAAANDPVRQSPVLAVSQMMAES